MPVDNLDLDHMKSFHVNKPGAKAPIPLPETAASWTDSDAGAALKAQTDLAIAKPAAASPRVIDLTDATFASFIDGHPFAIIAFGASSSAPSRSFASTFRAVAARHTDLAFASVDVERQRAIVAQLNIRSVPTLLIFRDNIVVFAKAGAPTSGELDNVLAAARALDMDAARRKVAAVEAVQVGSAVVPPAGAGAPAASDENFGSIETWLHPSLRGSNSALTEIAARLAAGGLIAIPNAFDPEFAERMHRSLDRCTAWRVHENYAERFSYQHHNLYHPEDFPEDLARCSRIFDSPASKAWAARLSGRECTGPTSISASWYLPGDHSLPHSDNVTTGAHYIRQLAFVWHLSKDWRPEWGGALYWCSKAAYQRSAFNTLYLFNVGPESTHFVTHVSPYARGKRLTVNGWWTGPAETGAPAWKGPERLGTGDSEILIY